jgi:membrane protease YdiL (CAAX protease family)
MSDSRDPVNGPAPDSPADAKPIEAKPVEASSPQQDCPEPQGWYALPEEAPQENIESPLKDAGVFQLLTAGTLLISLFVVIVAALGLGDDIVFLITSAFQSVPFVPLTLFAYAEQRIPAFRMLTYGYWLLAALGITGLLCILTLFVLAHSSIGSPGDSGATPEQLLLRPENLLLGFLSFVLFGASLLVGISGFTPPVRWFAARLLPFDSNSFVHATALATVFFLGTAMFVPLLVLRTPPLLHLQELFAANHKEGDSGVEMRATVYGCLWLVASAIAAVGYPIRRTLPEALARLGVVKPRLRDIGLAVVATPLLVGLSVCMDPAIDMLWSHFGWTHTDMEQVKKLFQFTGDPVGVVVLAVTAGIGEELVFRGILQPRLGILLTNIVFAGFHALQYNWDGLLSVFVLGLVFGLVRKYSNTTTSAIVHGCFDFALLAFGL